MLYSSQFLQLNLTVTVIVSVGAVILPGLLLKFCFVSYFNKSRSISDIKCNQCTPVIVVHFRVINVRSATIWRFVLSKYVIEDLQLGNSRLTLNYEIFTANYSVYVPFHSKKLRGNMKLHINRTCLVKIRNKTYNHFQYCYVIICQMHEIFTL